MNEKKKKLGMIIITVIMISLICMIGPMDIFSHGFYCDEIKRHRINPEDFLEEIHLEDGAFEMKFSPEKKHLKGFEINLAHQPENNTGTLLIDILNEKEKCLGTIKVDLSKVESESWYKVYTDVSLKKGEIYTLRFSAQDCETVPYLQVVNPDYLPEENVSGNILLGYGYAESTFTFQNKILIGLFIISGWLFVCAKLIDNRKKKCTECAAVLIFLTAVLSWNYMYNSMDVKNDTFTYFQEDSETLVRSMIYADRDGAFFMNEDELGFGLGRYTDIKGEHNRYDFSFFNSDSWINGYSRTEPAIRIDANDYTEQTAVAGHYAVFDNDDYFLIERVEEKDKDLIVYLQSEDILTEEKYGSLGKVTFYDNNEQALPPGILTAYKSQYGLHGKVFREMARHMDEEQAIATLNLICCIAAAVVLVAVTWLIYRKYNLILSGCFFMTFWLSPWTVNYAKNLYWLEFTWFIPMAIGLFCSLKIDHVKCRIFSYIAAFVAIAGKSLCGYEYLSVIMMGLIAFLLVDLLMAMIAKDRQKAILLFRTIFIIGTAAVLGFIAAICIHAVLQTDGSILEGMHDIFAQVVLKRTSGTDLNTFVEGDWESLNASVWETFCKYFHFSTEIIVGVDGNLFPLLCILPVCIFVYEFKKKCLNVELAAMYVVFFLTSASWFCLAKAHSYIHTHMNFVLWYFGFIQISIYIIVRKIIGLFQKKVV